MQPNPEKFNTQSGFSGSSSTERKILQNVIETISEPSDQKAAAITSNEIPKRSSSFLKPKHIDFPMLARDRYEWRRDLTPLLEMKKNPLDENVVSILVEMLFDEREKIIIDQAITIDQCHHDAAPHLQRARYLYYETKKALSTICTSDIEQLQSMTVV